MYRTVICRQCKRLNQNFYQTLRIVHRNYSNHYETLNLKPNCTAKDIRDSFIKLSKENHPDTSTNQNSGQNAINFRKIVEAYKVLGRADSRAIYDTVINQQEESTKYATVTQHTNTTGAYYGVFGSKRISNRTIVLCCILFMIVGAVIQAWAIRCSVTFRRDKLDRASMEAGKVHSRIRANAMEYDNAQQINKLQQRFSDGK